MRRFHMVDADLVQNRIATAISTSRRKIRQHNFEIDLSPLRAFLRLTLDHHTVGFSEVIVLTNTASSESARVSVALTTSMRLCISKCSVRYAHPCVPTDAQRVFVFETKGESMLRCYASVGLYCNRYTVQSCGVSLSPRVKVSSRLRYSGLSYYICRAMCTRHVCR